MVGGGEMKVATVDVESSDNMATLPVSRAHGAGGTGAGGTAGSSDTAEKNNAANKEMELKNVMPKPLQRTSLFIVTSLVYAMLLIVVCVAYVISDVTTHRLPVIYYEGFFTYLYGASILFLLYVFCFLLQESSCCNGKPKPPKEKKPKKEKKSKKNADVEAGKEGKDGKDAGAAKDGAGKSAKEESKGKGSSTKASSYQYSKKQEVYPKKKRDQLRESQRRRESATAVAVPVAVPASTTPSVTPGTPASPCTSISSTPAKRRDIRPEQVRCHAEPCWVQERLTFPVGVLLNLT
uniref:Uncharacterized protein n=1 Tax=Anopheles culicifacies TaxID=139723 RepID=A0A182LWW4_9DIPT